MGAFANRTSHEYANASTHAVPMAVIRPIPQRSGRRIAIADIRPRTVKPLARNPRLAAHQAAIPAKKSGHKTRTRHGAEPSCMVQGREHIRLPMTKSVVPFAIRLKASINAKPAHK